MYFINACLIDHTAMDTEVDVRASVNTEGGETVYSIPGARSQLRLSMSSMGGESLQEIWKMLDDGRPSPTPRMADTHITGNVMLSGENNQFKYLCPEGTIH